MNEISYLTVSFFCALFFHQTQGNSTSRGEIESGFSEILSNNKCLVKYTFRDTLKDRISCDAVRRLVPICARDIRIGFSVAPPYATDVLVMNNTNSSKHNSGVDYKYSGILFGKFCFLEMFHDFYSRVQG